MPQWKENMRFNIFCGMIAKSLPIRYNIENKEKRKNHYDNTV